MVGAPMDEINLVYLVATPALTAVTAGIMLAIHHGRTSAKRAAEHARIEERLVHLDRCLHRIEAQTGKALDAIRADLRREK